jgi:hypothetical protein
MDASSAPSALAAALQAALALAPSDQARLCALLQRLTDASQEQAPDLLRDTELATRGTADPQAAVEAWLQDIAVQPAWLRLQLLDDAIGTCDTEPERELLQAAHAQLLHSHPPLAVRRTVTELATLHPASTGFAVVGLLLGLTGLARLVLHGLF